ncbi:MAG: hypothetical protein V1859_01200 [archaeon]
MPIDGVTAHLFPHDQLAILQKAAGEIRYVVTLVEDEIRMGDRLANTSFFGHLQGEARLEEMLRWTAAEVGALSIYPSKTPLGNEIRHIITPTDCASETVAKLMTDESPTVVYAGCPISHLREKEGDGLTERDRKSRLRSNIIAFQKRLSDYCVSIVPITMADGRANNPFLQTHVINRDLNWFIRSADCMIAYYPDEGIKSKGLESELDRAKQTGKFTIIISQDYARKEVFDSQYDLCFATSDDFFKAVDDSVHPKYDNTKMAYLRRFLDDHFYVPRYASIRPYDIAVDVVTDTHQHIFVNNHSRIELPHTNRQTKPSQLVETETETIARLCMESLRINEYTLKPNYAIFELGPGKYVRIYQIENWSPTLREMSAISGELMLTPQAVMNAAQATGAEYQVMPWVIDYMRYLQGKPPQRYAI